ncbi:MAG: hypothetical protein J6W30_10250 [Bacteroidales bacterium]|nr:hypothetical protein [Bacteroidales bacterium]
MRKTIITFLLSIICLVSSAQIKMHNDGRITFQTLYNTTGEGISIDPGPDWNVNFNGSSFFKQLAYFVRNANAYNWTACAKTSTEYSLNWVVAYPTYSNVNFYVYGNGCVYGRHFYVYFPSSTKQESLEKGEEPINSTEALEIVNKLEGFYYPSDTQEIPDLENNDQVDPNAIAAMYEDFDKRLVGLSATGMSQVFPEGVRTDPKNRLCIDYFSVVTLLVEAVKAQQDEIKLLKDILKKNNLLKP